MPQATLDLELIHQNKRHSGGGCDADGTDEHCLDQIHGGEIVESCGNKKPGHESLYQTDDQCVPSNLAEPADMQLFADAEGDNAQEDKNKKVECVERIVIYAALTSRKDTDEMKGIRTHHGSTQQLSGDLGKAKPSTQPSPEMRGEDDQAQCDHLN